jgi:hypothetical protein
VHIEPVEEWHVKQDIPIRRLRHQAFADAAACTCNRNQVQ